MEEVTQMNDQMNDHTNHSRQNDQSEEKKATYFTEWTIFDAPEVPASQQPAAAAPKPVPAQPKRIAVRAPGDEARSLIDGFGHPLQSTRPPTDPAVRTEMAKLIAQLETDGQALRLKLQKKAAEEKTLWARNYVARYAAADAVARAMPSVGGGGGLSPIELGASIRRVTFCVCIGTLLVSWWVVF